YYFDPNSFAPETRGVLGNAGRNYFHGPGINNFTFGLYKDTRITETTKLELRFEFFNLFNHTQFTSVGTDINSSTFGRATAARPPPPWALLGRGGCGRARPPPAWPRTRLRFLEQAGLRRVARGGRALRRGSRRAR